MRRAFQAVWETLKEHAPVAIARVLAAKFGEWDEAGDVIRLFQIFRHCFDE